MGALVGWDGCEVRLCDPCARVPVCVPAPPGVFLPLQYPILFGAWNSPSFLIVNGGAHAGAGPTPLWGKR